MTKRPPDPRIQKDVWDNQHRLLAEDPLAWVLKADALAAAFEILVAEDEQKLESGDDTLRLSSVTFMLAGFAIEVLLKALLIQKTTHPLNEKGQFQLKSHDLVKLAQDAAFNLTDEDVRLLEKLEQFLTWGGRYPIPLTSESMLPRSTSGGGFAPRTYHSYGEDWPAIRTLVKRLKELLPRVRHGH